VTETHTTEGSNVFSRVFASARSALRDMAARHALRQELLECDRNGVLDSILQNIQVSRSELEPMMRNYPLSRRLFAGMAARLRLDPRADGSTLLRALQHTCTVCAHQRDCQQWLKSGRTEGYEEFCPNAEYWHDLKERIRIAAMRRA
jgi:hypothetical protein